MRVLIVDPEPDVRGALELRLQEARAEVRTASSAAEALADLERWRPDILVADIAMPEEDAYSLIGKIRALKPERGGQTPAIALTPYASTEDARKVLAAGFQRHIAKPVVPSELIAAIASPAETPEGGRWRS